MTALELRQRLAGCMAALGLLSLPVAAQTMAGSSGSETPRLRAPVGFQVELIRHGAMLGRPVAFGFDDRGRTWVASAEAIDTGPGDADAGRLVVLGNDRDDERAEDTLFATGLLGLSAFVFHRDGVIAAVETGLVWLRDEDGDGRAEVETDLFHGLEGSGWVIRDLVWGLDGWIYGALGAAAGTAGEPWQVRVTVAGDETPADAGLLTGGLFRMRPTGNVIEQVIAVGGGASSLDKTWDGDLFFSTPGAHAAHMVVFDRGVAAGRVNEVSSWAPITRRSLRSTAEATAEATAEEIAGATVYGGGAWPDEFANSLYVADAAGARVRREPFQAAGLSYQVRTRSAAEFLVAERGGFHPVALAVGPGAALYVLDGTDAGGRLWRVRHTSQKEVRDQIGGHGTSELFGELAHPNAWRRWRAHRLLGERDLSKVEARDLARQARSSTVPWFKIHALWLGVGGSEFLSWALGDYFPSVRLNALRVAASYGAPRSQRSSRSHGARVPASSVITLVGDGDARVRFAALLTWSSVVGSVHLSQLIALYPELTEDYSRSVALAIAARHPAQFIQALFREEQTDAFVGFVRLMTDAVVRKGVGGDAVALLLKLTEGGRSPRIVTAVLDGLTRGSKDDERPWPSPRLTSALRRLAGSDNERVALAALPLAERWGVDQIATRELTGWVRGASGLLDDPKRSFELRLACVRTLLAMPAGRAAGLAHVEILMEALERGALEHASLTDRETALVGQPSTRSD